MSSLARLFSLRSFDHRSIFTVCLRLCLVFLYGTAGCAFQFNTGVNSGFQLIIQPIFSCAAQDGAAVFLRCAILGCIGAASRRHACCSGAHIAEARKNSFMARCSAALHLCRRKAERWLAVKGLMMITALYFIGLPMTLLPALHPLARFNAAAQLFF